MSVKLYARVARWFPISPREFRKDVPWWFIVDLIKWIDQHEKDMDKLGGPEEALGLKNLKRLFPKKD